MEDLTPERKIVRMKQVFAVGGTYNDPSNFTKTVNKNLVILGDSDRNCEVQDIKFNVFNDQRYTNSSEVDVDVTPEPESTKKKGKKRKKKK